MSETSEYIEKGILTKENKIHAANFVRFYLANGIGSQRIRRYLIIIKKLDNFFKKDLKSVTKDDIIDFMAYLNTGKSNKGKVFSDWTKYTDTRILKKFYEWLFDENEYKNKVCWLKVKKIRDPVVKPETLIEPKEFEMMLRCTKHPRDRAILMVLYEIGLRSGELRSIRIKNLELDGTIARIRVSGKTGERRVILIKSFPFIMEWLNAHMDKNNPDAFLFPTLSTRNYQNEMTSGTLNNIIKKAATNAGIKKRVFPHLLRHVSATRLSKDFSESEMRDIFGWSRDSTTPSTYIHMSGKRIERHLMEVNGLIDPQEDIEKKKHMKPKDCPRCDLSNTFNAKYCIKCGMPFDRKDAMTSQEKWNKIDEVMNKLVNLPQFKKMVTDILA